MLNPLHQNVFGHTVEIWRLFLKVKIPILILCLSLIYCAKISATEQKYSGNFTTEHIRELWQMCSIAHQQARVDPTIYFPHCDCAVDTMRENYDNASIFKYMEKSESEKLSVLVRLNCNKYRLNGITTD